MAGKATEARRARILERLEPNQLVEVMADRPSGTTYEALKAIAQDELTRRPVPNRAERRKAARNGSTS